MKNSLIPLSLILSSLAYAEIPPVQLQEREEPATVQNCYLQYEPLEEEVTSKEDDQSGELTDSSQTDEMAGEQYAPAPSKTEPASKSQKQGQRTAARKDLKAENERSYVHPKPINQGNARSQIADQQPVPMSASQPMAKPGAQDSDAAMFNDKNYPGFYIGGDFIYWKAEEEHLDYAINGQIWDGLAQHNSLDYTGKIHTPIFEWEPGFKIQVGYCSEDWAWDTFLNWTWLQSDAEGKAKGPNAFNDKTLYAIWSPTDYLFGVDKEIESHWTLKYNTLDWLLGRSFSIGKHFSIKPMTGVRGAWIDQTYNLDYLGVRFNDDFINKMPVRNKGNFHGGGVMGGISTSWYFTRHFSIFSDAAFSLIYGHTETRVTIHRTVPTGINNQKVVDFKGEFNSLKSEIEAGLGMRLETDFNKNKWHIAFDVKWEYLNWFNINPFMIPIEGTIWNGPGGVNERSGAYSHLSGSLGMMGLTVGAKVTF